MTELCNRYRVNRIRVMPSPCSDGLGGRGEGNSGDLGMAAVGRELKSKTILVLIWDTVVGRVGVDRLEFRNTGFAGKGEKGSSIALRGPASLRL